LKTQDISGVPNNCPSKTIPEGNWNPQKRGSKTSFASIQNSLRKGYPPRKGGEKIA
jgi:hypothetical protein